MKARLTPARRRRAIAELMRAMGRVGGLARSARKTAAVRRNGKLGALARWGVPCGKCGHRIPKGQTWCHHCGANDADE